MGRCSKTRSMASVMGIPSAQAIRRRVDEDLMDSSGGVSHRRFFRDSVTTRRGGVSAIRCLAVRRNLDVEIGVTVMNGDDFPAWRYELAFNQDNQRRPRISKELVRQGDRVLLKRPDDSDRQDAARLTQTCLEQVYVNQPFRELAAFFASIRYLHIVPQFVREPDRSIGRANDPFGGDFLEQIAKTPDRTRNARLRKIRDALKVAVPQLDDIQLWRDNRGTPHLR